jgi:hypothetical protein
VAADAPAAETAADADAVEDADPVAAVPAAKVPVVEAAADADAVEDADAAAVPAVALAVHGVKTAASTKKLPSTS